MFEEQPKRWILRWPLAAGAAAIVLLTLVAMGGSDDGPIRYSRCAARLVWPELVPVEVDTTRTVRPERG